MLRIISSFGFGRQVVAPAYQRWLRRIRNWNYVLMWKTGGRFGQ